MDSLENFNKNRVNDHQTRLNLSDLAPIFQKDYKMNPTKSGFSRVKKCQFSIRHFLVVCCPILLNQVLILMEIFSRIVFLFFIYPKMDILEFGFWNPRILFWNLVMWHTKVLRIFYKNYLRL